MKKITLENYAADRFYPKIVAPVAASLRSADSVAPIDVFVSMGLLEKQHVDDWRRDGFRTWRRSSSATLRRPAGFFVSCDSMPMT